MTASSRPFFWSSRPHAMLQECTGAQPRYKNGLALHGPLGSRPLAAHAACRSPTGMPVLLHVYSTTYVHNSCHYLRMLSPASHPSPSTYAHTQHKHTVAFLHPATQTTPLRLPLRLQNVPNTHTYALHACSKSAASCKLNQCVVFVRALPPWLIRMHTQHHQITHHLQAASRQAGPAATSCHPSLLLVRRP